jgi:hypothetical protein
MPRWCDDKLMVSALASKSTVGKQLQLPHGQVGFAGRNEFPQFFGLARREGMESGFTLNARGSRWRRRSKGCRRDPTFGQAGQSGLRAKWTTQNGQSMTTSTCLKPMRHPWTLSGSFGPSALGGRKPVGPRGLSASAVSMRHLEMMVKLPVAYGQSRRVMRCRYAVAP